MRLTTAALALLLSVPAAAASADKPAKKETPKPRVLAAAFSGVISPVSSEFLVSAIKRAEEGRYDALVIELDTPGGLDLSMRDIVKAILGSQVPVIVHVAPSGGRAASAGVFITMAAHVAAMAPGTNIGAAHPVRIGGAPGRGGKDGKDDKPDPVMEEKMTNDASAYLEAIASRRGRNAEWAKFVVAKSSSIPSGEAVRMKVVDLEAEGLSALLKAVDGRVLADFPRKPLRTADAAVDRYEMTGRQKLLAAVTDPNIAMILMTLGVSGLLIELYNPGLIVPGIVGAASLIVAFYSFQTLSANFAGVLLILLGFVLYLLELKVVSFGLLALSGTAAVLFGSLMLFQSTGGWVALSWGVIGSAAATLLAIAGSLAYVSATVLRRGSSVGAEAMAGEKGVVVLALDPAGTVKVHGETWRAVSADGSVLPAKAEVVVVESDGLTLKVRRA